MVERRTTIDRSAGRLRRFLTSITTRLLLSYVLLLMLAIVASLFAIRQALHARLDEQINDTLLQEVDEFERLVGGNDPRTGQPFGEDLKAIFDVYFKRNVPGEGETILAILGREPYKEKHSHDAGGLSTQAGLIGRWTRLRDVEQGETETSGGLLRYMAVPVEFRGKPKGTFVVGNFPAFEHAEIDEAIRVAFIVGGGVLLFALMLAAVLARRILSPLRGLTETARGITDSDLTRRIPVRGNDEISRMATTFNQMLDRLEEAFRAQRRFVDDAGHELRTPITVIRGHLELLEDDPEKRRETLALVMDELDRMNRLVNDLLVLAKSGQPGFLELEVVDAGALTEEILAKARGLARRKWQRESGGPGRVVLDRQRVTQAMMQLAHNAVNHTTEDDSIALGCSVSDGEARFWVRDSGPGVPADMQELIFERFARGPESRRRSSNGAGLGLAIVQVIARAHSGRVELYSQPGRGATFTLVLPVDQPRPPVATEELQEVRR